MKDLAAALVYSASGVTRVVDGLERAGYARRVVDPDNRRSIRVTLTDGGLAALQAAWPTHLRGVRRTSTPTPRKSKQKRSPRSSGPLSTTLSPRSTSPGNY
ncbi:MarR family transcriptional regulator [Mycobacterium sp. NPDC050441]|uniref:MarR family winged helix-turn-helix transcriptional regulator n=1 Tax=Mycobacterium sp. NPDC050441 TaxID=3155403 RepID=UPI0034026266